MNPKQRRNKKLKLLEKGSRCWICGGEFPPEKLTLDHLKPKSKGGSDSLDNLRLACLPCNQQRKNSLFPPIHKLLTFKDEKLLHHALTHRSYANENPGIGEHNERLEFLGDAILTFISGEYLYQRYPQMGEDEMTRRRSALVDQKQLARFAIEVGLDLRMRLGQGLIKEGGYQNPNLLSSTFEAIVGAYYLDRDRNIQKMRPVIESLFDSVPQDEIAVRSNVDSKNKLQEFVQARGAKNPPRYVTEKIGGMDHAPEFMASVYIDNKLLGKGKGRSKKEAEKEAAVVALGKLKEKGFI